MPYLSLGGSLDVLLPNRSIDGTASLARFLMSVLFLRQGSNYLLAGAGLAIKGGQIVEHFP